MINGHKQLPSFLLFLSCCIAGLCPYSTSDGVSPKSLFTFGQESLKDFHESLLLQFECYQEGETNLVATVSTVVSRHVYTWVSMPLSPIRNDYIGLCRLLT